MLKKEEINIAEASAENLCAHFVQEQPMKTEASLALCTYLGKGLQRSPLLNSQTVLGN